MVSSYAEDKLEALKEKFKEPIPEEPEPQATAEIVFLCTHEGCGKTFANEGACKKHALSHGLRQHVCSYPGCEKVTFICIILLFLHSDMTVHNLRQFRWTELKSLICCIAF